MPTISYTEVDVLALEVDAADMRMSDDVLSFMTGTHGGFTLRGIQSLLSVVAACAIISTGDFNESVNFKLFLGILFFHILYSFCAGAADIHALYYAPMHVRRPRLLWVWIVGDLIMLHLVSCGSFMYYGLIRWCDIDMTCCSHIHCPAHRLPTAIALVTSVICGLTFLQNFRFLIYRSL